MKTNKVEEPDGAQHIAYKDKNLSLTIIIDFQGKFECLIYGVVMLTGWTRQDGGNYEMVTYQYISWIMHL